MAKTLSKCGRNQFQGGVQWGVGFGPTARLAKRAAAAMATSFIAAVYKAQLAGYQCPETCPNKQVEGVINERLRERVARRIAPGLHQSVVTVTYDLLIVCK